MPPFGGLAVPAVTRTEFAATGFTAAHLAGARLVGWSVPSTLVVEVRRLLGEGEPFIYAYYEGLDKVAHEHGLGEYYAQELRTVDRLVGDLVEALPAGAALVVTSDHGQVEVGSSARLPGPDLMAGVELCRARGASGGCTPARGDGRRGRGRRGGARRRGVGPDPRADRRRGVVRRSHHERGRPPAGGRGPRGPGRWRSSTRPTPARPGSWPGTDH